MKVIKIGYGQQFEQIKSSSHTNKLHRIEVRRITSHFESSKSGKSRNYTYVYYVTVNGSYYPAANSTGKNPLILDGLVGCMKLTTLNNQYREVI